MCVVRLRDRGVEFAQAGNITNFIFFNHDRLTVRFTLMLIDVLHYSQTVVKRFITIVNQDTQQILSQSHRLSLLTCFASTEMTG